MKLIIVAGSTGQHAAIVYEAAKLSGQAVAGFITIDEGAPVSILDCPYLGNLQVIAKREIERKTLFVVACGSNMLRRETCESLMAQGASLKSIVHPAAIVSPSARIAQGSVVLAGAIIGTCAEIGRGVIVNHAASVGHGCRVDDYVNICSGARLAGGVHAQSGVFVGLNASIIQGLQLGENATIGAGAVVTRHVEAGATVVGVPARPR